MVRLICHNFPCENYLPETYFRVVRIIRTDHRRRSFNFCSLDCMIEFFGKLSREGI